jgi:hypothetical protein
MDEQAIQNELSIIEAATARIRTAMGQTAIPPTLPADPPLPVSGKIRVQDNTLIRDMTLLEWIRVDYWTGLGQIMTELDASFPNRKARKLEIIDACPITGNSDHPGQSHAEHGKSIDGNYFTLGDTNHTEARDKQHGATERTVFIWDDIGANANLTDLFDEARNLMFVVLFFQRFPQGEIRMDIRIKQRLQALAWGQGTDAIKAVSRIMGDDPCQNGHHTHFHAQCEAL